MSNFKQNPFTFSANICLPSDQPQCPNSAWSKRVRYNCKYSKHATGNYWNIFTAPQNVNFHVHIDEPQIGHDTQLPETVICGMIGFKVASFPEHIRQAVKTGFDTAVDNYVSLPF